MSYITGITSQRQNFVLNLFFTEKSGKSYILHFPLIYDLITNKARKVEVAQSNLMMKGIPHCISLSVGWGFCPSLLLFHVFSLPH